MKTIHVKFTGNVQGVGFRRRFAKLANTMGIRGWVKNMDDGSVEASLQGPDVDVKRCIDAAGSLPGSVSVNSVQMESIDEEAYQEFSIVK